MEMEEDEPRPGTSVLGFDEDDQIEYDGITSTTDAIPGTSIGEVKTREEIIDPQLTSLTKKNDHPSKKKSVSSVKETPSAEYYDETDYSVNIANAVASILAEDIGNTDDHIKKIGSPILTSSTNQPKRLPKKRKSKLKLPRSKSSNLIVTKSSSDMAAGHSFNSNSLSGAMKSVSQIERDLVTIQNDETAHSGLVHKQRVSPPASLVKNPNMVDVNVYLARVQGYFNKLGYLRQGEPKIHVQTHKSMKHQTDTARLLIRAGEPIKCLHALVLGIHFTNCTDLIERFTINFRSFLNGKEYKHVVLGIYMYGYFGSIGISRDVTLQYKPVAFPRLSDLIKEFHYSYLQAGHILTEVRIGGIVTHDPHSLQKINWKLGTIKAEPNLDTVEADKLAKCLRQEMGATCLRQNRVEFAPTHAIPDSLARLAIPVADLPSYGIPIRESLTRRTNSKNRTNSVHLSLKKKTKN